MSEQTVSKPAAEADEVKTWKRRGLLAAAWAAAVGFVLRATTQPVAGANGDPVLAGSSSNIATSETWVHNTGIGRTLFGYSSAVNGSSGVEGWCNGSNGTGVLGTSANNTGPSVGVTGYASSPAGTGVLGQAVAATGNTYGVYGSCASPNGNAVFGSNDAGGTAILGRLPGTTSANGIALYGLNNSSYAGPGPGAGGFGVYGLSAKGHGLVGATSTAGAAAVVGATNGVSGAYAGAFYGPVIVSGAFTAFGVKSAAVPHPDGSHRRLYCLESPESWFEDFGEATLECGEVEIALDPDFAAVVETTKYHVFVTGYDDFELRVSHRTPAGFRVTAKDNTSRGAFSWRIVAKRKDIEAPRFETVVVPPAPALPTVADEPMTRPPVLRPGHDLRPQHVR